MAVTATFTQDPQGRTRTGRSTRVRGSFALSGTYDVGGFSVTASTFGLGTIKNLYPSVATNGTVALATVWDATNSKIKLFETAATVDLPFDEFDNGNSVASYSVYVEVEGSG